MISFDKFINAGISKTKVIDLEQDESCDPQGVTIIADEVPKRIKALKSLFFQHFQMPLGSDQLINEAKQLDSCLHTASHDVITYDHLTWKFADADSDSDCDYMGPIDEMENRVLKQFKIANGILRRHHLVPKVNFFYQRYGESNYYF